MTLAIMTDTSSGITPEEATRRHLTLLNAPIMIGNRQYHEFIDMDAPLYDRLHRQDRNDKQAPTTPQISMAVVQEALNPLIEKEIDTVIVIAPSSGLSGFVTALSAYAEGVRAIRVVTVDSLSIDAPMGNQARLAAAMLERGATEGEILSALTQLRQSSQSFFLAESMKPLLRTGDMAQSRLSLPGRPVITFTADGHLKLVQSALLATNAQTSMTKWLATAVSEDPGHLSATVLAGDDPVLAQKWQRQFSTAVPEVTVTMTNMTPSLRARLGADALGLVWSLDYLTLL